MDVCSCLDASKYSQLKLLIGQSPYFLYKVTQKTNGDIFLLKELRCTPDTSISLYIMTYREWSILVLLHPCKYILKLLKVNAFSYEKSSVSSSSDTSSSTTSLIPKIPHTFHPITIFEYVPMTLVDVLISNTYLPLDQVKYYMRKILKGLVYIHSAKIVHRNLKPETIFIDPIQIPTCVKIGGFEFARAVDTLFPYKIKTDSTLSFLPLSYELKELKEILIETIPIGYRAPEIGSTIGMEDLYSYAIDMWALGWIFIQLLLKTKEVQVDLRTRYPEWTRPITIESIHQQLGSSSTSSETSFLYFKKTSDMSSTTNSISNWSDVFSSLDRGCIHLMTSLLEPYPRDRFTAQQALGHIYFTSTKISTPSLFVPVKSSIYYRNMFHGLYYAFEQSLDAYKMNHQFVNQPMNGSKII